MGNSERLWLKKPLLLIFFSLTLSSFVKGAHGSDIQNVSYAQNSSQYDRVLQSQYSDCVSCTSSSFYWCGDSQSCKGTSLQCGANCTAFSPSQCSTTGSLRCNGGSGLPPVNNYYSSASGNSGIEYWLPEVVVIVALLRLGMIGSPILLQGCMLSCG